MIQSLATAKEINIKIGFNNFIVTFDSKYIDMKDMENIQNWAKQVIKANALMYCNEANLALADDHYNATVSKD